MKKIFNFRNSCRLCLNKKIVKVIKLGPTPIADKYLSEKNRKDFYKAPLDIFICKSCGHVQLPYIVNPDYIWSNFTFKTGQFNFELINHFKKIFLEIKKMNVIKKSDLILDIGSNDGSFLKIFKKADYKNILGIDPSKKIVKFANRLKLRTVEGYFNYNSSLKILKKFGSPMVITSFNSYAHSDDIISITKGIKKILHKDGVFIFKVSYLLDVIKKRLLGTIFHEHLDYHSVKCLDKFLRRNGLEIFKVERNKYQGGSIIGYVQHLGGANKHDANLKKIITYEKKIKLNSLTYLRKFNSNLLLDRKKINSLISKIVSKNKKIIGFGASRSSITFFSFYKIGKYVKQVIDQNKMKINKFYPDSNTQIVEKINFSKPKFDYIIILAWLHSERVIKNLKKKLPKKIKFISIYPKISII